ncbi:MAG TPA: pyruvate kinase, partial [Candidatus Hodarchaeales archaeon]|nr:pyruvate kinase [Candidatus Hodarchaeales archaeon]
LYFPTEKDLDDAKFACSLEPDFFAASFVRRASDLKPLREIIDGEYRKAQIISKIEHRDALRSIDDIIEASDGIMVARGDLGIEIPTEEVPIVQKDLIRRCNSVGKPVITATQMLESMTVSNRPTRAEASDVSNAVFDGTDAVMLSAETASGKYPVESIEYMNRIIHSAEKLIFSQKTQNRRKYKEDTVADVLGHVAQLANDRLGNKLNAIIAITRTGRTARLISRFRPRVPIIGATSFKTTFRQLQLVWGVVPLLIDVNTSTDQAVYSAIQQALAKGHIQSSDQVIIIAGSLLGVPAPTNLATILKVSDVLSVGATLMENTDRSRNDIW